MLVQPTGRNIGNMARATMFKCLYFSRLGARHEALLYNSL